MMWKVGAVMAAAFGGSLVPHLIVAGRFVEVKSLYKDGKRLHINSNLKQLIEKVCYQCFTTASHTCNYCRCIFGPFTWYIPVHIFT